MIPTSVSRALAVAAMLLAAACGGSSVAGAPGSTTPSRSISVSDGESLIRAMQARYEGRWPATLTYVQTTEVLAPGATAASDQVWYEAFSVPGRLRIDYGNPDLHNGLLFNGDSSYQFSNGTLVRASSGWNDLLLLTQDVYAQSPEITISVLRALGIQMSRFRSTSFDGRTAWVVGSTSVTDSASRQFWIERDRLVLVRLRERRPDGQFIDIRFGNFKRAGDGFVAGETYQFMNGMPRLHQRVSGITAGPTLDPALFDPAQWSTVRHWSRP